MPKMGDSTLGFRAILFKSPKTAYILVLYCVFMLTAAPFETTLSLFGYIETGMNITQIGILFTLNSAENVRQMTGWGSQILLDYLRGSPLPVKEKKHQNKKSSHHDLKSGCKDNQKITDTEIMKVMHPACLHSRKVGWI